MKTHSVLLAVVSWLALANLSSAQAPSYARQIKPLLAKYCSECHSGDKAKGEFVLDSFALLQQGGKHGPAFVTGKPDDSRLILMVEGKAKPPMPPAKVKQPQPEEVALFRAWVAAGAKDDSKAIAVPILDIKPRVAAKVPVTALAFRPDGKQLAAAGSREVLLLDATTGDVLEKLKGQAAKVTNLVYSRDGQWLAVASGTVGMAGEVRLYTLASGSASPPALAWTVKAHQDLIHEITFSPDGKRLASCGYDRLIKLWDVQTGKQLRVLKDHSDAVYGVAFSPDGRLLASAAADRAVKVWAVATGRRLYTLGESTDWVYAVAWHPDGKHLAAAGVDKSIRVWEVTGEGGRVVYSVFAHEAPVTRLVYSADGKLLYSLGEDRAVKTWLTERMVERNVYAKQPESVLALVVRPDHKQLALGRYDGVALLVDEATGKALREPLPVKPKPPQVAALMPNAGQRGHTVRVTFTGKNLDAATGITVNHPGVTANILPNGIQPASVQADVTFPSSTPSGVYKLALQSTAGKSAEMSFTVDLFSAVTEQEPNDSPSGGQVVKLPASVAGVLGKAGEVDYFRFEAAASQQLGVQAVTGAAGSKLEPVLQLLDPSGLVVAESTSGVLGHVCETPGVYALGVRDRDFRGGTDFHYRLHLGDVPVVTAVYPLGVQRGQEADIQLDGVNLGSMKMVRVKVTADAAPGARIPLAVTTARGTPLGNFSVVAGEFPEVVMPSPKVVRRGMTKEGICVTLPLTGPLPVPGTGNGRIAAPGETDVWPFAAKKGQRLIVEINARRLGSPLDSVIEILDCKGQPVLRATLRSLAKTYSTFRDHDSAGSGIRIETWGELAVNDYLYAGNELLRIRALPKNPDDDCQFFSAGGQRTGFLDTTPAHVSLGTPMYKVEIHPPSATFPPNGFPVVHLPYRNDDGGPGYGKDSRLYFDPPADGEYLVRVGDARGQGGRDYIYRLTVRPPRPDFTVSFSPANPTVWKGGAVPLTASLNRIDGFDGAVELRLDNLPPGFTAPATNILPADDSTAFALSADAAAKVPEKASSMKLVARATINGKEVVREAAAGLPKLAEPGDLQTVTEQSEVTVKPGGETRLTVKIERKNGFTGRVPLDVRGLPHGVRVLDIGLNGILITERETTRTFVIYAEPWVQPAAHPFVVLARSERKGTEHAAKSVLLRVDGKP